MEFCCSTNRQALVPTGRCKIHGFYSKQRRHAILAVLIICFGEATKFSNYLLDASKSYRALCQLGKTTSTGDAEGDITSDVPVQVDARDVQRVLTRLTGRVEQIPPMYSAVKHQGQRLYKLARKGKVVDRSPRQVEIYSLEMIALSDNRLEIDVHCSKGTYIRTLAEDIGKALGCGAFLARLERTGVHPFWEKDCYSLDQLCIATSPESRDYNGLCFTACEQDRAVSSW